MRPKNARSFQKELSHNMADVVQVGSGEAKRRVTLVVAVPGGGKTIAVTMALETLRSQAPTSGMKILWVVPRNNLKRQAAKEASAFFGSGYYLKELTGSRPPFLDANPKCMGYVVTYQALGALLKDPNGGDPTPACSLHKEAMIESGQMWLVVFDECHHLADFGREIADDGEDESGDVVGYVGGQWCDVVKPLHELSWHTIMMTGTPERHDGRKLPFAHDRYTKIDGKLFLTGIDVHYKRMTALQEKALKVIQFRSCDGWAAFKRELAKKPRKGGEVRLEDVDDVKIVSLEKDEKKVRKIIRCLLEFEGYWKKLLSMATRDWREWRTSKNYQSRMLVICDSQSMAIKIRNALREWGVQGVYAATSSAYRTDETRKKGLDCKHGKKVLDDFRENNDGQVLVTVAMAHEGFDVKNFSHVVFLSSRRSLGWVTQAIDRGSRFDPGAPISWEEQKNFVYAPDDFLMQEIVQRIRSEQFEGIVPPDPKKAGGSGGDGGHSVETAAIDAGLTTDRTIMVHNLDEIPAFKPRPKTETVVSTSPHTDAALLKEIERLAADRDVALKVGKKSKRTLNTDLPRMLKLNRSWKKELKGESLVRVRDFLKKMVCPV